MNPHRSATTWVEVDLDAVRENVRAVLSILPHETNLAAVVKADAYGHGAVPVARAVLEAGASWLAVTSVEEAVELRDGGIQGTILLLAPLLPEESDVVVDYRLTPTIGSLETAQHLAAAAQAKGVTVPCHLEVDTGMGRSGVAVEDAASLAAAVWPLECIRLEGLWQHFANAYEGNNSFAEEQWRRFREVVTACREAGVEPPIKHAANSAALLAMPQTCLDMVRVGTLLYGQYPSSSVPHKLSLRETWRLKTRIVELRRVPRGGTVGYGREWKALRRSLIAALRVGYAHGLGVEPVQTIERAGRPLRMLRRMLGRLVKRGGPACPTVRGVQAPIVGRISMTQCSLDVTDVPGVTVGDEVVLPVRRVTVSARVPRIYEGETGQ